MLEIALTFFIALTGGIIAIKLKVPAGAMVGAMIAVAFYNVVFDTAYFPANAKIMTQMVSGIFIGCKITREDITSLKLTIKPAILNLVIILFSCIMMGILLYYITDNNLATCLFATAPGSMVDMAIISIDMNADTSVVSVLQLLRLLTILGVFPTIFGIFIKKVSKDRPDIIINNYCKKEVKNPITPKKFINIFFTSFIAIFFGLFGKSLGIPAGTLVFAMIAVTIQNITTRTAYMPFRFKQFAQVCAGALIGESVNRSAILSLRHILVPAVILLVGLLIIVFVLSFILYKTSDLDFVTALFSCAPGGASDLALIAEDFGADTSKVSIIQIVRVISVIILYPPIIQLLTRILP